MRERRDGYLADFAHVLHIRPQDWDGMTVRDTEMLMKVIDQYRRDIEAQ